MTKVFSEVHSEQLDANRCSILLENGKDLATGLTLGAVCYTAYTGQRSNYYWGYGYHMPDIAIAAANSAAHPFLGFLGAAVGYIAASRHEKLFTKTTYAYGAATTVNFLAETTQDILQLPDSHKHFYSMPFETGKDYAFALVGAALFMMRRRKRMTNN